MALILGRVERYIVEQRSDGVVLRMRQGRNALGVLTVSLVVLLVSWWFGPYGPRPAAAFGGRPGQPDAFYWIWLGFFAIVALASLLGAFFRQDWLITGTEIIAIGSFGPWKRRRRIPTGQRLVAWKEVLGGEDAMFRYRIHFLAAEKRASAFYIEFQSSRSVDRFLELVRPVLTLDVVERMPS